MARPDAPAHAVEAASHPDPYPYYRALREQRPLYFEPALKLWVASSAALVEEALRQPALRVRPPQEPVPSALLGTAAGEVFAQLVRMNDGAFHAQHRPEAERSATRYTLAQVAAAVDEALGELLPVQDANRFLTDLPVRTMACLLQIPAAERATTSQWVHDFTAGIAAGATPQTVARADTAAGQLMAQGARAGLAPVRAANRIALMQQSLDATAGLLGNSLRLLQRQPAWAEHLRTPEQARAWVAEVERWDAPIQNTRRFAAQDLPLGGQQIRQGEGVLLVLAAANRDEALNPQAERFDPSRSARRSLGFGAGMHHCPGEVVAIEIVASSLGGVWARGQFDQYFNATGSYRPLPNARIPIYKENAP
ncbi:cytochrome P450 [Xylophilus sp. GW821-FHT01B05]